ncbi:DNA-3-methyladenine glycosylase [Alcanivorax sp. 97CO-5]|uniref:DNA-3-methyladenine glycosylase I n=1 Tax=unclassified Alcanivorax TaxID=2638842 RepID=UPI0003E7EE17|nr:MULTISPECIES: DNA-3-methyladenine glycosylase I [unclassified Alcanivorax]EUC70767.1 DNA-3-methyladenine glycosylase [Alcanivorax sp. 97CO-5]PKG02284.1 DNA-3-methyladenine glycosylase I [Alcanivorax sp. 97CO-6]
MNERCPWCGDDPLYQYYHDHEWGVPNHDERSLFECLNLEGAQAGLSWITVLRKRKHYRRVFDGFDAEKIARYDERKVADLLVDSGIIRNRLKVAATIGNAQAYLALRDKGLTLDQYLWGFVEGKPQINHYRTLQEVPTTTALAQAMSKDLKKRGFRFVGPTIVYAFMQATGMVNDHLTSCPRHRDLNPGVQS